MSTKSAVIMILLAAVIGSWVGYEIGASGKEAMDKVNDEALAIIVTRDERIRVQATLIDQLQTNKQLMTEIIEKEEEINRTNEQRIGILKEMVDKLQEKE